MSGIVKVFMEALGRSFKLLKQIHLKKVNPLLNRSHIALNKSFQRRPHAKPRRAIEKPGAE